MAKSGSPKWERRSPWVVDWFTDFVGRLIESPARHDWPSMGHQLWLDLERSFVRAGIHECEAEEGRRRLADNPPPHLDRMIPALIAHIAGQWDERDRSDTQVDIYTRDGASYLSADCIFCGGQGLASLYRHASAAPGRAASVQFYCVCPMGQWVERAHKSKNPEICRRIPNLSDYPDLIDEKYLIPPGVEPNIPEAFRNARAAAARLGSVLADGATKTHRRPRIDSSLPASMDETDFLAALGELEGRYWETLKEGRRADILYRARHGRAQGELESLRSLAMLGARMGKGDLSEGETDLPPRHAASMPAAPMNLNEVEAL